MRKSLEQVYVMIQSNKLESTDVIESQVNDWFWLGKLLSNQDILLYQEIVEGDLVEHDERVFSKKIPTWSKQIRTHLTAKNNQVSCECYVENGYLAQTILLSFERYKEMQSLIEDYIDCRMMNKGLYAYIRDYQEYLSHNLFYLEERDQYIEQELPLLRKMKNDEHETVVDCSQLSGYDLMYERLCLTSCWKMWFSSLYYHLVPKQAFLDVQQVDSIEELDNEVIKIKLFDSPVDWPIPANQHFQKLFRKQLGFDQIEWINGVGVLEDPYAEFIKAPQMIQMIQYQNDYLQPIEKNKATHFVSRMFNYTEQVYIESRQHGQLNYQAYFPFEIKETKENLAYWLLNTEYCLDGGTEAFTYYIDYYLRALQKLSMYKKQATVLKFYLPEKAFNQLALDNLVQSLTEKKYLIYPSLDNNHYLVVKYGQTMSIQFEQANKLREDTKNWRQPTEDEIKEKQESLDDKIKNFFHQNSVKKEE
ncbi:hypothetical protein [Vagococcus xieshaowenii]|uniref:Uncharacterized protein n=1 Tax=Vagococcus xieshaowenii TaxID=2562451 RepID=A0A4Z0DBH9_9ENTE|nr:hypothetical protein [Vagococcus xieshaowenii]QCA28341.1 hypothetical protein E4Z98_03070 [Vagococcus xieshaowenii]TFZ42271.1 hypothetical protein E4031_03580 [Vagococcus xieshaowenii]